jgi:predicted enzyme related to lactoylglutathione lyase
MMSAAQPMHYVEFSVADVGRAKAFYSAVFGWEFTDYGPDYSSFTSHGLAGGFRSDQAARPGGPLMVFHVDDLEAALERAKQAGAPITKAIFSFPGGSRFEFKDPDGYDAAAWKPE